MPAITTAMKCHAIDDQTDMYRLFATPRDKYPVFFKNLFRLPVDDLIFKAGDKVTAGFVVRRVMKLNSKDVPVIEDHQTPAVHRLKTAGAV